jgi:hypothetical protein
MNPTEFNDLVGQVRLAGFEEAANLMVRKKNSKVIPGDFFAHVRSKDRYIITAIATDAGGESFEATLVRV